MLDGLAHLLLVNRAVQFLASLLKKTPGLFQQLPSRVQRLAFLVRFRRTSRLAALGYALISTILRHVGALPCLQFKVVLNGLHKRLGDRKAQLMVCELGLVTVAEPLELVTMTLFAPSTSFLARILLELTGSLGPRHRSVNWNVDGLFRSDACVAL